MPFRPGARRRARRARRNQRVRASRACGRCRRSGAGALSPHPYRMTRVSNASCRSRTGGRPNAYTAADEGSAVVAITAPAVDGVRRYERRKAARRHEAPLELRHLSDTLEFETQRRGATRWRPDELRPVDADRRTLGEFVLSGGSIERPSSSCVETCDPSLRSGPHAQPPVVTLPVATSDVRKVVGFRGDLLPAGGGSKSVMKTNVAAPRRVSRTRSSTTMSRFDRSRRHARSPGRVRGAAPQPGSSSSSSGGHRRARITVSVVLVRRMAHRGGGRGRHARCTGTGGADAARESTTEALARVEAQPEVRGALAGPRRHGAWRCGIRARPANRRSSFRTRCPAAELDRTWRRRIYVPSAGPSAFQPSAIRSAAHSASLLIAEQRL
jgi:hypothetical protein